LAIYKAQKTAQKYFPHFYNAAMHRKYVFVDFSEKMSFADISDLLRDMNPQRKIVSLFRAATRMKR
jgi:hypothetical protein